MPKLKPFPKVRVTFNLEEFDFVENAALRASREADHPEHEIGCQVFGKLDAAVTRAKAAEKRRRAAAKAARNATYC